MKFCVTVIVSIARRPMKSRVRQTAMAPSASMMPWRLFMDHSILALLPSSVQMELNRWLTRGTSWRARLHVWMSSSTILLKSMTRQSGPWQAAHRTRIPKGNETCKALGPDTIPAEVYKASGATMMPRNWQSYSSLSRVQERQSPVLWCSTPSSNILLSVSSQKASVVSAQNVDLPTWYSLHASSRKKANSDFFGTFVDLRRDGGMGR